MKLTVAVNQAEAIRRGFNADSTVKLEVDIAMLPPAWRRYIANRFDKGKLYGTIMKEELLLIPEPTLEGFHEVITKEVET